MVKIIIIFFFLHFFFLQGFFLKHCDDCLMEFSHNPSMLGKTKPSGGCSFYIQSWHPHLLLINLLIVKSFRTPLLLYFASSLSHFFLHWIHNFKNNQFLLCLLNKSSDKCKLLLYFRKLSIFSGNGVCTLQKEFLQSESTLEDRLSAG